MDALRAFGAIVDKSYEGIRITAPNGLHGANIELPYPSVGATEQVLLTAVKAKGVTELRNAAIEPEIMDLIAVLQKMGAIISYEPNRVILIEGVDTLQGYDHRCIFDRNEAASWACAALATDGDIFVGGAKQQEMLTFLNVFRKVGGSFDVHEDGIRFRRGGPLKPVVVETDVHPGFMTDWQQPLIVALTQAEGESVVHETVYENRLGFTEALVQMGADIVVHPQGIDSPDRRVPRRALEQAAVINGPTPLHGADVVVPDLRGGYSYVIAALAAEGESIVRNVGHHPPRLREVLHQARRARRRLRRHRIAAVATSSPRLRASAEKTRPSVFWPLAAIVVAAHRAARPSSRSRAAEKLPREGAYVLAPNHYTEFDPLVVAARGLAGWAARRGSWRRRASSASRCSAGSCGSRAWCPVARSSSAASARLTLEASETLVEHGRGVIVYPEGTLTRDPDLWPMRGKTGAVRLALAGGIPLIPMAQWGCAGRPARATASSSSGRCAARCG